MDTVARGWQVRGLHTPVVDHIEWHVLTRHSGRGVGKRRLGKTVHSKWTQDPEGCVGPNPAGRRGGEAFQT